MSVEKKFRGLEPDSDDVGSTTDGATDAEDEDIKVKEPTVSLFGRQFDSLSLLIIGGVVFAGLVTLGLLISIALGLNDDMRGSLYTRGAVASDSSVCSEIGYEVLKKNGSGVDAAIATLTCLGVVRFHTAGIGGGGSMVIRNASGNVSVIDYRETAPGAATRDMFAANRTLSLMGGLAVAVPGQMKGLSLAYQRHGRLPWSQLITPSINLARNGFKLEKETYGWAQTEKGRLRAQSPRLYSLLFSSDGTAVPVGTLIRFPDMANLLQSIADGGSGEVVYNGSTVTHNIVNQVRLRGGRITVEDMQRYEAVEREAISTRIRGNTYFTSPPPSSGATLLSMLGILRGFGPLTSSVLSYHRMVEAMKFAYARRSELGDMDFESSVALAVSNMISLEETDRLRSMINDSSTQPLASYGIKSVTTSAPGTVHVSVERGEQEAVSVTESLGSPFGSYVLSMDGILLNNAMNDFSVPGEASQHGYPSSQTNFIQPRKRPLSSTSPLIVVETNKNDSVALRSVIGAGGGPTIPSTVLQVVVNLLDKKMTVGKAVAAKRLHERLIPDTVDVEAGFPTSVVDGLRARGHKVAVSNTTIGHCTAINQNTANPRRLKAAADRRNGGVASYGALFKQT